MAMKRFPSNKLMEIEGIELQTKLSKCTCESEVEDTFKNYFMISSMMNKRFASCGLPPSKSYSKVKYLSPKMESYLESKIVWIDPKFELHKMIKDIYKHCIKK